MHGQASNRLVGVDAPAVTTLFCDLFGICASYMLRISVKETVALQIS